jgi:hypothetical protein
MQSRISDVIITLDKKYENRVNDAVDQLKTAGVRIDETDTDNDVVEGTVDVGKVRDLEKLDCVDYVRTVFTYDAET